MYREKPLPKTNVNLLVCEPHCALTFKLCTSRDLPRKIQITLLQHKSAHKGTVQTIRPNHYNKPSRPSSLQWVPRQRPQFDLVLTILVLPYHHPGEGSKGESAQPSSFSLSMSLSSNAGESASFARHCSTPSGCTMLEGRWLTIPQHFPRTATEMVPNHTPFGCVADNDRTDLTSSILLLSKLLSLVLVVMRFLRYRLLLSADVFALMNRMGWYERKWLDLDVRFVCFLNTCVEMKVAWAIFKPNQAL